MIYEWVMRHFNIQGTGITAASYDPNLPTNNEIRYAADRQVHLALDTWDELSMSLYLDDPMAATINPLSSVIKMWRKIYDDAGTLIYEDIFALPAFCGVVGYVNKNGEENKMQIKVYSPLWRLQFRFHILNHYLQTNTDTNAPYKQSELVWKLIELVNQAYGVDSYTGIDKGTFSWFAEPTMAPYFVGKGTNTWANIRDDILARASSPEIIPKYTHQSLDPSLMTLDTDKFRGTDRRAQIDFRYHTGTNDNLINFSEEIQIAPDQFANYQWVVGHGGPNSGKVQIQEVIPAPYGRDEIGIYMSLRDKKEIKLSDTTLTNIVAGTFQEIKNPPKLYSIDVSPTISTPLYGQNYQLGDAIKLNANKGALVVTNVEQRIFEATLAISENNVENVNLLIANDMNEKIIT